MAELENLILNSIRNIGWVLKQKESIQLFQYETQHNSGKNQCKRL
jgi:hypothetical protein